MSVYVSAHVCVCECPGRVSDVAQELVAVTQQCLQAAIDVCGPGVPFRAIGEAISCVADAAGEMSGSKGLPLLLVPLNSNTQHSSM